MLKLKTFILVSGIFTLMSATAGASPCENNRVRSLDEAWEGSSVAVAGRVTLLEELKTDTTEFIRVGVAIDQVYKGQDLIGLLTKEIKFVMPASGSQGRQNFLVGSTYTMFGQWREDLERLYTNVCWRNNLLNVDGFNEDIERLLILSSSEPESSTSSDFPSEPESLEEPVDSDLPENP